jgi:peptidoglycan/xylan/chitin deacetylase (PgdA/CDA1 family)
MKRITLLAWILILGAVIGSIIYFAEPVEEVLLSFDVDNSTTAEELAYIASFLEERDAVATFFVTGYFAMAHEELLRNLSETHEIACRGMTGSRMPELNQTRMEWEILTCKQLVENITNTTLVGFRAPQALTDERVLLFLQEEGFLYDASSFENLEWFSPPPTIASIPLSSWGVVPLVFYRPLGDMGYFLMTWDKDEEMVFGFSPKHVNAHRGAFEYLLESYDEDVKFLMYKDVV